MFSRNRSALLLEQPLLSRFAPDFRRRTRAFGYKPPHKIHNTSPSRAITTEDIHRSREFMQNRGGDSLADRRFSKQNPSSSHRLASFSSLASGKYREAFASVSRTCTAISLSPAHRSPSPSGTQRKSRQNYTRTSEGEASPWLHRRRGPQCGSATGQCYAQFPPHANEEGDVRTENDECAHQSSTKRKEKGAEEEGTSVGSSPFARRNEEKPGDFAE